MDIETRARELADRVHVAMIQTMQGNGDITAARNIGGAIISQALQAVRDEAFEEAAVKMDELREVYKSPEYSYPNGCLFSQLLAKSHAEAIRSLKERNTK